MIIYKIGEMFFSSKLYARAHYLKPANKNIQPLAVCFTDTKSFPQFLCDYDQAKQNGFSSQQSLLFATGQNFVARTIDLLA